MNLKCYLTFCTVLMLSLVIYIQNEKFDDLKVKVKELTFSYSVLKLKQTSCLGEVRAYDKVFDYHIVLSELGIYPPIREGVFLTKKEEGD